MSSNVTVQEMTDLEIMEAKLDSIDLAVDTMFHTAEQMFHKKDKDVMTTELKLLIDIGAGVATIKICCNKLRTQLDILKDLQGE